MNGLIKLYTYLKSSNNTVKSILKSSIDSFNNNELKIASLYAIYKDIINLIKGLDKSLFLDEKLVSILKEISIIDKIIETSYHTINSDLLYDFFNREFDILFSKIEELVK